MGSLRQMYAISAAKARGHSILMAGWVRFTVKSTAQRIAFLFWMPSEGRFGLCWKERASAAFGFQLSAEALEQLTFILRKYMEVHMGIRLKTRDFFEQ